MENKLHSEQDALAQTFRVKLAQHSMPVDPSVWASIQARLHAKGAVVVAQKTKRNAALWWVPLSAAASLALLLTFGWLYQPQQGPVEELAIEILPEIHSVEKPLNPPLLSALVARSVPIPEINLANVSEVIVPDEVAELPESIMPDNVPQEEEPRGVNKLQYLEPASGTEEDWTKLLPVKKSRPLLAAVLGSGFSAGSSGYSAVHLDAMNESFLSHSSAPMRAKALSPADFDKKEYLPPLSAGVKLRFPFTDRLSVETGVQYTFLHTKLSNEQWTGRSADIKLHYLGIPLGVALILSDSPKWQLYLSGGVLAEKGLQSVYNEYRDWGNAVFNTNVSKGIDGMQWSIYSSIGAGYYLGRNAMLYFEPQFSYYFDNDQPLSIRTEQSFMMGLTTGIRFSF